MKTMLVDLWYPLRAGMARRLEARLLRRSSSPYDWWETLP